MDPCLSAQDGRVRAESEIMIGGCTKKKKKKFRSVARDRSINDKVHRSRWDLSKTHRWSYLIESNAHMRASDDGRW